VTTSAKKVSVDPDATEPPLASPAATVHAVPVTRTWGGVTRLLAASVVTLATLLLLDAAFGSSDEWWLLWIAVGLVAGSIAGEARSLWLAIVAAFLFFPVSVAVGLSGSLGPYWLLQAVFGAVLAGAGFAIGSMIGWSRRPWAVARESWLTSGRRRRIVVMGPLAVALITLGGYLLYAGARGSDGLMHPERSVNCETPRQAFGWAYEAINYDPADDATLAATNPDPKHCSSQGSSAGTEVVSRDGVPIAGWYIPADSLAPSGPTILIVHGWSGNKSSMLPLAGPLHDEFNIAFIDLRDSGRSGITDVTMGVREQFDVEAMVDWLERTKHPSWIGAIGNSMGGATVLAAAASDQRLRAVLLESTHASAVTSGGNVIENDRGFPAQPTGWATITAVSMRIGADVAAVDPARTIGQMGSRPVLLIHGTADRTDPPAQSAEVNLRAAREAGVTATLAYCRGGTHGASLEMCPAEWTSWARAFFEEASRAAAAQ
jgi:pimeloyl-ACP methyl ester carboxylesterase